MNPAAFAFTGTPNACAPNTPGTAPDDYGPDRIGRNVYDAAGQVTQRRVAVGTLDEAAEASFGYSANGQRTSLTAGNGNRAEMTYALTDEFITAGREGNERSIWFNNDLRILARRAPQSREQVDRRFEAFLPRERARVLGLGQILFGVEDALEIGLAPDILKPGEPGGQTCFRHHLTQEVFALGRALNRGQRILDLGQRRKQHLPIGFDALDLAGCRQLQIRAQAPPVENGRKQVGAKRERTAEGAVKTRACPNALAESRILGKKAARACCTSPPAAFIRIRPREYLDGTAVPRRRDHENRRPERVQLRGRCRNRGASSPTRTASAVRVPSSA